MGSESYSLVTSPARQSLLLFKSQGFGNERVPSLGESGFGGESGLMHWNFDVGELASSL